jgi:hypothetical protein
MGWDGDGMGWERRLVEFLFFPSNAVAPNYHAALSEVHGGNKQELEIGSDRGYLWLLARSESSRILRPGNGLCPVWSWGTNVRSGW